MKSPVQQIDDLTVVLPASLVLQVGSIAFNGGAMHEAPRGLVVEWTGAMHCRTVVSEHDVAWTLSVAVSEFGASCEGYQFLDDGLVVFD
jgi:hypothetical protein